MVIESIDSWLTDFCKKLGITFQNRISLAFFIKFLYMCVIIIVVYLFLIPINFILTVLKMSFFVEFFTLILDLIFVLISDQFKSILKKDSLKRNLLIIFLKDIVFLILLFFLSYYTSAGIFIYEILSMSLLIYSVICLLVWIGFTAWLTTKMVDGLVKKVSNKIITVENPLQKKNKRVLRVYILLIIILTGLFYFVLYTYLILDFVLPYKWGNLYLYHENETIGRWFGVMISGFALSILFAIIVSLYFVAKSRYKPSVMKILLINIFFVAYFYIKFISFIITLRNNLTYDFGSIIISLLLLIYGIGKLGVDFKEAKFFNTLIFVVLFIAFGYFFVELVTSLVSRVESYVIFSMFHIFFCMCLCFIYILYQLIKKSMKLCKKCGVEYDNTKNFCEKCGSNLILA